MPVAPRIPRFLDVRGLVERKSCFLFGPRQTGKSTLIGQQFEDCPTWNLLDQALFRRLARNAALIRESLAERGGPEIVVIDEIQRMPELLNEVQLMIEEHGTRFLLTGSSARALRRKGVNLLGGRAGRRSLHPLVRAELGKRFELDRALEFGLLPSVWFSDQPEDGLRDYAGDYLREEISNEAIVRNLPAFSRFLDVAALAHGEQINFASLGSDAQVSPSTARDYYRILQDTLLAHEVPAFADTRRRKAVSTSKFYLFDTGVARHLQGRRGLAPGTPEYGKAFESYLFQEIKAFCDYHRLETPRYWRSHTKFEVDFIFSDVAVEVKAARSVGGRHLKGLQALAEEKLFSQHILVSMDPYPRVVDGITLLPWAEFLDRLWGGELAGARTGST